MSIEAQLSKEIAAISKDDKPIIVAICGAADLGKSYLSKKITAFITKQHISTRHLTMDAYLMDRKTRIAKGLSGYNIEAYSLKEVLSDLKALKNKQVIKIRSYDHKTGKRSDKPTILKPPKILIFDGLHSMHSSLLPYIDLSIFLYTKDDYLIKIRKEADLIKRNYTIEFSEQISESEFNLYKVNVEPYKENANYLLFLKSKWDYELE